MIEDCKAWLERGGSYDSGRDIICALAEHNHVSKFTMKLVCSGNNQLTMDTIRKELTRITTSTQSGDMKLLRKRVVPERKTESPFEPINQSSDNADYELPPDLMNADQEIRKLYAKNRILKGRLIQIFYHTDGRPKRTNAMKTSKEARYTIAMEIVRNQKLINFLWEQIDHYKQFGVYSSSSGKKPMLTFLAELLRDQPQIINYIRKADSMYRKSSTYQNRDRYDEYQAKLKEIDRVINELL